ncbi:MAG: hypothetical protein ACTMIK_05805 [Galactobacter sp.]
MEIRSLTKPAVLAALATVTALGITACQSTPERNSAGASTQTAAPTTEAATTTPPAETAGASAKTPPAETTAATNSRSSGAATNREGSSKPSTPPAQSKKPQAKQPAAADLNGLWCPTEETGGRNDCFSIDWPTASYPNGTTATLRDNGMQADGSRIFDTSDAPFGAYYPAGIDLPDAVNKAKKSTGLNGTEVTDEPSADRIWDAQSVRLYTRM